MAVSGVLATRQNAGAVRLMVGLAVLAAAFVALALCSLAVGSRSLSLEEAWTGFIARDGSVQAVIVWQLRMPRTILAIAAGASLAIAGVVMQALTRNPLAEPGMLGVNAGASLAVVLAMSVLGLTSVAGYLWFAFGGAALAAVVVYAMSMRSADAGPTRLILAGVALGASLSAITGTITMYDTDAFSSFRFWVVGSLEGREASLLGWVSPFLLLGLALALGSGHHLNALALGDEQALALGADLARVRLMALCAITLLCGAATAAVGPISFVGLVVPQIVRLLLGADQRKVLWVSLLAGPVLLLAADVVGRVIIPPDEMEAGVVTAFVGAPVLLLIVLGPRWQR